jgi:hypothetical protein
MIYSIYCASTLLDPRFKDRFSMENAGILRAKAIRWIQDQLITFVFIFPMSFRPFFSSLGHNTSPRLFLIGFIE